MAPRCTVCMHPDRTTIDATLAQSSASLRDIAGQFGLSRSALHRHQAEHLPARLVKAIEQDTTAADIDVYRQLRETNAAVEAVLKQAQRDGNGDLVLKSADRVLKLLELQARLLGALQNGNTINIVLSPEWREIRAIVLTALQPYPEARLSVATALREVDGDSR